MRQTLGALLVVLLALCGCKQDASQAFGVHLREKTLANGLKMVVAEVPTATAVSVQLWVKVGSVDDPQGMTGLAHLFEHLMFRGTSKFPAGAFAETFEAAGGQVNALASRDFSVFYETLPPALLDTAIEMEADRLTNLKLDDATLENEKKSVLLEHYTGSVSGAPGSRVQDAIWALAFRRHPYRNPIMGFPQDMANWTPAGIREFYAKFFNPRNAKLVVTGQCNADRVFKKAEQTFGVISHAPKEPPAREWRETRQEPESTEERRLELREKVSSTRFAMAYRAPSAHEDDAYALDIAANLLFEGEASRAHRRLISEKDYLLSLTGSAYTPNDPGLFVIGGVLREGRKMELVEAEQESLLADLRDRPVSKEEIEVAAKQLTLQIVDGLRTPFGLGQWIGTVLMVFDDASRFAGDIERYRNITPEAVQRAANRAFVANARTLVIVRPEASGR